MRRVYQTLHRAAAVGARLALYMAPHWTDGTRWRLRLYRAHEWLVYVEGRLRWHMYEMSITHEEETQEHWDLRQF